jgi:hypothetical protein
MVSSPVQVEVRVVTGVGRSIFTVPVSPIPADLVVVMVDIPVQ